MNICIREHLLGVITYHSVGIYFRKKSPFITPRASQNPKSRENETSFIKTRKSQEISEIFDK